MLGNWTLICIFSSDLPKLILKSYNNFSIYSNTNNSNNNNNINNNKYNPLRLGSSGSLGVYMVTMSSRHVIVSFIDQNFRYNSLAIKISHDSGLTVYFW